MRKFIFELASVLVMGLFLVGAGCNTNVNIDANKLKDEVSCNNAGEDYLWLAGSCCFDKNHNKICDDDEGRRACSDECSQSGCMKDEEFTPYDCVIEEDGCRHIKVLSPQLNRCGVECISDKSCPNQKCRSYKCIDKICGDNECDDTENCNCIDCKVPENSICCEGVIVEGNCCSEENCKEEEFCISNYCVKCGDGTCNNNEDCLTCPEDCLEEGKVCCEGILIEGDCCNDSSCEGNMTCVDNVCS